MLLKRFYDIPPGWEAIRNTRTNGVLLNPTRPEDALLNPLPIKHLSVKHTGVHVEQNFSRQLIDAGVSEGWATLSRGQIILHAVEEDLVYTITAMPGRYCLHCGEFWAVDPDGQQARTHMSAQHGGMVSPDPNWPHGYKVVNGYECVLDASTHERWHCPPYATVSHARWKSPGEERVHG